MVIFGMVYWVYHITTIYQCVLSVECYPRAKASSICWWPEPRSQACRSGKAGKKTTSRQGESGRNLLAFLVFKFLENGVSQA
jgi:hypothetical protein